MRVRGERKPTHMSGSSRPFLRLLRKYPEVPSGLLDKLERRSPNERVAVAKTQEMLRAAVVLTGDEDLGLRGARETELGDFEVVEYVCASAPTLRAVLEALIRYRNIVDEAANVQLDVRAGKACFMLGSTLPMIRAGIDYAVAVHFIVLNRWLRPAPPNTEARFRHAQPAELGQYRETFGPATLCFGADFDGLVFDAGELDTPLRTADATTHGLLRTVADKLLADVAASEEDWLRRVRSDIVSSLAGGDLGVDKIAAHLGMSRRTLARRLEGQGTSFSAQVLELRKRTAEHYLRETEHSVEEIAFLVGFSQSSPFVRAFKQWAGVTPTEFRRAHRRC